MERLTVVALGPDRVGQLTLEAAEALRGATSVLLRTGLHGAAEWLDDQGIRYETLDALYESAEDFDGLNEAAAAEILRKMARAGSLCYGVPDPMTDATVAELKKSGAAMKVIAGVTQAGLACARALESSLPARGGYAAVAATDLTAFQLNPALPLIVTELNSRLLAGEVKVRLLTLYAPETRVILDGKDIPLELLDRQPRYDHLSTAYVPASPMAERARYLFADLLDVMARLRRASDGCPWDLEQTHETLREYMIEEAYELVDAVNQGDAERVADELGDVLLQVVFHARIAQERGEFDIGDVTTAICHKMITRHAHIFGDVQCETADDVLRSWESIKKKEKGQKSAAESMRDIPGHLPALMRAAKVQKKARQVGFDWDSPLPALDKVLEEAGEARAELDAGRDPTGELGDLLFAAVNAARLCGVQPELALGEATGKFVRRFQAMEEAILAGGKDLSAMTLAEMDGYWDAAKRAERSGV